MIVFHGANIRRLSEKHGVSQTIVSLYIMQTFASLFLSIPFRLTEKVIAKYVWRFVRVERHQYFLFNQFPDVYHCDNKKGGTIHCLFSI